MPLYAERPPLPSDDKRWRIVNGTMRKHGYSRNALIETLHTVQSSFGFLDMPAIKFVAQSLRVPLSQAYGVVTFYHFFSLKPPGKHTCTVCTGTACYIKGAEKLVAQSREAAAHPAPARPRPTARYRWPRSRCVGACGRAPVVLLDGELSGADRRAAALTAAAGKRGRRNERTEELQQIAAAAAEEREKYDYRESTSAWAPAAFPSTATAVRKTPSRRKPRPAARKCHVRRTGCMGPCAAGPMVERLRGRGGAGFPTGLKWSTVAKVKGRAQICRLQWRRGRPGRVHGSQRARERPAYA
jgi:bidirectional [NiFe] hydrogenase diaphorase subunit